MKNEFENFFIFELTVREATANLLMALVCGIFIALLYRITYRGLSYSASLANSIILLTMITALVIMVIGNNLARAFGLVGAMSIIRFRTAVKDPQDIMFIFFALGIGLSSGAGLYAITLTGTVFISAAFFLTSRFRLSSPRQKEFLLQITFDNDETPVHHLSATLEEFCKSHKLVNVKSLGDEDYAQTESSYYISLKEMQQNSSFVRQLKKTPGVQQVNLFFDEE